MGAPVDLKSFSAPRQIPIERAIESSFGENIVQAAHYMDGWTAMMKMLKNEGIRACRDAKPEDHGWLELLAKTTLMQFYFVWFKSTGGAYSNASVCTPQGDFTITRNQLALNYQRFRDYWSTFANGLWISLDEIMQMDESSVRPWHL
jgi:hypothetical protein